MSEILSICAAARGNVRGVIGIMVVIIEEGDQSAWHSGECEARERKGATGGRGSNRDKVMKRRKEDIHL